MLRVCFIFWVIRLYLTLDFFFYHLSTIGHSGFSHFLWQNLQWNIQAQVSVVHGCPRRGYNNFIRKAHFKTKLFDYINKKEINHAFYETLERKYTFGNSNYFILHEPKWHASVFNILLIYCNLNFRDSVSCKDNVLFSELSVVKFTQRYGFTRIPPTKKQHITLDSSNGAFLFACHFRSQLLYCICTENLIVWFQKWHYFNLSKLQTS